VPVGQHQRIGMRVRVVVRHLQTRFEALRNERLVAVSDLAELGEGDVFVAGADNSIFDLERFPVWEYALDEEGVGAKMKLRCDLSSQMGCLIQTMGPSLCVPS